jgi:hypothetical protein
MMSGSNEATGAEPEWRGEGMAKAKRLGLSGAVRLAEEIRRDDLPLVLGYRQEHPTTCVAEVITDIERRPGLGWVVTVSLRDFQGEPVAAMTPERAKYYMEASHKQGAGG